MQCYSADDPKNKTYMATVYMVSLTVQVHEVESPYFCSPFTLLTIGAVPYAVLILPNTTSFFSLCKYLPVLVQLRHCMWHVRSSGGTCTSYAETLYQCLVLHLLYRNLPGCPESLKWKILNYTFLSLKDM